MPPGRLLMATVRIRTEAHSRYVPQVALYRRIGETTGRLPRLAHALHRWTGKTTARAHFHRDPSRYKGPQTMDAIPFQVGSPHSLVRALLRRNAQGLKEAADATPVRQPLPAFTIAFSREAGTRAVDIAHELGVRLNWPVFDRELVGRIADDLGLRAELLEEVDEKQVSWIEETVATFGGGPVVSGAGYAKHLASTVLALGAHGECIIVGRGSAQILPAATTLRVRLIAPLKDRAQVIGQRLGISFEKAQRRQGAGSIRGKRLSQGSPRSAQL
jgi:hypothetical protein